MRDDLPEVAAVILQKREVHRHFVEAEVFAAEQGGFGLDQVVRHVEGDLRPVHGEHRIQQNLSAKHEVIFPVDGGHSVKQNISAEHEVSK